MDDGKANNSLSTHINGYRKVLQQYLLLAEISSEIVKTGILDRSTKFRII